MTDDARLAVLAVLVRRLALPTAAATLDVLRWPSGPVSEHRCRLTVREWRELPRAGVGRAERN